MFMKTSQTRYSALVGHPLQHNYSIIAFSFGKPLGLRLEFQQERKQRWLQTGCTISLRTHPNPVEV